MLSAETATGEYPFEAVSTMSKIAKECEKEFDYHAYLEGAVDYSTRTMSDAIGISVAESCLTMDNISAIILLLKQVGHLNV